ncbi:type II secretion system protein GspK [Chrysiogenes arsenatis]|uniref:type II secretion system protein GspK n=1 Tax=Chrysiogenes arsenatis TaxID=309797 RepID=UPI0003FA850B|nr:type II secretion system protein GspK [Chrysiogenes arsenatis]
MSLPLRPKSHKSSRAERGSVLIYVLVLGAALLSVVHIFYLQRQQGLDELYFEAQEQQALLLAKATQQQASATLLRHLSAFEPLPWQQWPHHWERENRYEEFSVKGSLLPANGLWNINNLTQMFWEDLFREWCKLNKIDDSWLAEVKEVLRSARGDLIPLDRMAQLDLVSPTFRSLPVAQRERVYTLFTALPETESRVYINTAPSSLVLATAGALNQQVAEVIVSNRARRHYLEMGEIYTIGILDIHQFQYLERIFTTRVTWYRLDITVQHRPSGRTYRYEGLMYPDGKLHFWYEHLAAMS